LCVNKVVVNSQQVICVLFFANNPNISGAYSPQKLSGLPTGAICTHSPKANYKEWPFPSLLPPLIFVE
jgi:hypothetical protein